MALGKRITVWTTGEAANGQVEQRRSLSSLARGATVRERVSRALARPPGGDVIHVASGRVHSCKRVIIRIGQWAGGSSVQEL